MKCDGGIREVATEARLTLQQWIALDQGVLAGFRENATILNRWGRMGLVRNGSQTQWTVLETAHVSDEAKSLFSISSIPVELHQVKLTVDGAKEAGKELGWKVQTALATSLGQSPCAVKVTSLDKALDALRDNRYYGPYDVTVLDSERVAVYQETPDVLVVTLAKELTAVQWENGFVCLIGFVTQVRCDMAGKSGVAIISDN